MPARKRRAGGVRGERHPDATLTETDVRRIRRELRAGKTSCHALAEPLDVSPNAIWNAATGKTWVHVKRPKPLRRVSNFVVRPYRACRGPGRK